MQITFLNAAGTVLFVRNDMEEGHWIQEEYTVNASFPYDSGKVIQRGMRICFRDPATNGLEFFEIRSVTNREPDHGQQISAEAIVVSELSDDHINSQDITSKTPAQALTTALSGTLWSVGNATVSNTSSGSFSRGNVWQAVQAIQKNWNCYILPRITVDSAGNITGRYLDIGPAQGTWRGMYLSVNKNMSDSTVIYDDSEVLTALYGYGGMVDVTHSGQDDTQEELTFASVTWSATSSHPAKPNGQTYLEDPAKTALYGRNGRPRYGYYQNGDIKDAEILLEKTWEALQATSEPKIQISGTCTDLYRLGYADQPMRLHDTVIVEIKETGEKFSKEIIKLDVNLLDPTDNRPDIGSYIPNIIYINKETAERASGGGGGGGGRGQTNAEDEEVKTFTDWVRTQNMIGMVVGYRNGNDYIKAGQIVLSINESGTSGSYVTAANINANHIVIGSDQSIDQAYRGQNLDTTLTVITSEFTQVNTLLAQKIEASDINATTINAALANASLQGVGTLSVSNSIGCTGPISGTEIWSGGSQLKLIDASVSQDGKTLTITRVSGGAINFNKGDETAAYNSGWNDCIAAATSVTRYTRNTGTYGGNDTVHYILQYGNYTNVGAGWWKTSSANAYTLPAPKS